MTTGIVVVDYHEIKSLYMKLFKTVTALIFILLLWPFSLIGSGDLCNFPTIQSDGNPNHFSHVVMQNDTGGWYYQIYSNNKSFIIQKNIPAIQGVIAFSDSSSALKIANLVINKLEVGAFPPAVSLSELDSLKIIF